MCVCFNCCLFRDVISVDCVMCVSVLLMIVDGMRGVVYVGDCGYVIFRFVCDVSVFMCFPVCPGWVVELICVVVCFC